MKTEEITLEYALKQFVATLRLNLVEGENAVHLGSAPYNDNQKNIARRKGMMVDMERMLAAMSGKTAQEQVGLVRTYANVIANFDALYTSHGAVIWAHRLQMIALGNRIFLTDGVAGQAVEQEYLEKFRPELAANRPYNPIQ